MATVEIRYQVGEAWKGTYDAYAEYSLAAVVKDPQGMGVYRSLRSGNVGHPLTDPGWWFCIIDMSNIANLNNRIAFDEDARARAELEREHAETGRMESEINRNTAEDARARAEAIREHAEDGRAESETNRSNAEDARARAELEREHAEDGRVESEINRSTAENARTRAEKTRQLNENNRYNAETERVRQAYADHLLSEELNTHPMRINTTTGTWERWDVENDQYVDTGVMAMASPFATFDVDVATGCLMMTHDATYTGPQFSVDQNTGNLLLTI